MVMSLKKYYLGGTQLAKISGMKKKQKKKKQ